MKLLGTDKLSQLCLRRRVQSVKDEDAHDGGDGGVEQHRGCEGDVVQPRYLLCSRLKGKQTTVGQQLEKEKM